MNPVKAWSILIAASMASPLASLGQSITGTVVAADTGAAITAATVVAKRKTASTALAAVYKVSVDSAGKYALTLPPGQYQLCVYGAGPYLDPCLWSAGAPVTVASAPIASALTLQKGVQFILRVHDPSGVLPKAESVHGAAVGVILVGSSMAKLPLPLILDSGSFRDYGLFVPFNSPLTVLVTGSSLSLTDQSGAALNPSGIPFQVSPSDFPSTPRPSALVSMFRPPTAKVIHAFASALQ